MEEKLHKYVEELFAGAPKNSKTNELRDEILKDTEEKYRSLLEKGATEEEAYEVAKQSIGNVNQLISGSGTSLSEEKQAEKKKKSAINTAIAVALYILSPVAIILLATLGVPVIGVVAMFALIAGATGLLVYNNIVNPKFQKMDETMVEDFREWKSQKTQKKDVYGSLIWLIAVVVFFLLSFMTGAWYITWLVFIMAAIVHRLVRIQTA